MPKRGNGEGTIYKRKDGRWCTQVTTGKRPDGRLIRPVIYGRTRKEVAEKMAAILHEQQQGLYIAPDNETTADYMWRWLEHAKQHRIREYTASTYEGVLRLHIVPALGDVKVQELRAQHVQSFLDSLSARGLATGTVTRIYSVLRRALEQAYKWGLVVRNVADQIEPPRGKAAKMQALTPDEAARLLAEIKGDRLEAYYTVALTLGLRRGEALGLRWEDLDFLGARLRISRSLQRVNGQLKVQEVKTAAGYRSIKLPALLLEALMQHHSRQVEEREAKGAAWQDSGFIFCTNIGTPIEPRNIRRHFLLRLEKAGLPPVRVHDMRHTAASLMYAQGIPLEVISEILGHADKRTTANIYLHIFEKAHDEAADRMNTWLQKGSDAAPGDAASETTEGEDYLSA